MRVGFCTPFCLWPYHYAAELELICDHAEKGHNIFQFVCNASVSACFVNPEHRLSYCIDCILLREEANIRLLPINTVKIPLAINSRQIDEQLLRLPNFWESLSDLMNYTIDNFPVGLAASSSIISYYRTTQIDVTFHRELINRFMQSSLRTYLTTLKNIEDNKIEMMYLFNGRFDIIRAVFEACRKKGIPCHCHETASDMHHYYVFRNRLPHVVSELISEMVDYFNDSKDQKKYAIGALYYQDKITRNERWSKKFTSSQEMGKLPQEWDSLKQNIILFHSSDDEYAAVGGEWLEPGIYPNQYEGIKRLIEDISTNNNIHLYIRLHPNTSKEEAAIYRKMTLDFGNIVSFIMPDSKIDSYELLKNGNKVIVFSSTIGIESAYWGKPTILLGHSSYETLDSVYRPTSHGETLQMICDENLSPLPNHGAIVYGYFVKTFGVPFKRMKFHDWHDIEINGYHWGLTQNVTGWRRIIRKIMSLRGSRRLVNMPGYLVRIINKSWWKLRNKESIKVR